MNTENAHLVKRMEEIHFRNWDKGHIGGELHVPAPRSVRSNKKPTSPSAYNHNNSTVVSSLNYTVRKLENDRIHSENLKLFQKLS